VANVAAQILLVVHTGVTPQQAVRDAIAYIPADKLTGLVLNHSNSAAFDDGYGFGYGYALPQNRISSKILAVTTNDVTRSRARIEPVLR
jgi:hypothetical protein